MSACLHISLILTVIVSGHLRRTVTRPTQREILNLGTDSWNAGRKEPVFYLHAMYCFLIFELIAILLSRWSWGWRKFRTGQNQLHTHRKPRNSSKWWVLTVYSMFGHESKQQNNIFEYVRLAILKSVLHINCKVGNEKNTKKGTFNPYGCNGYPAQWGV